MERHRLLAEEIIPPEIINTHQDLRDYVSRDQKKHGTWSIQSASPQQRTNLDLCMRLWRRDYTRVRCLRIRKHTSSEEPAT
uniref:Uncharacterized protein n=1 Tax=Timema monikensis TaxID=170555 RepID=A0A7R9HQG0_9NEOP|nr:unnamed protein product [Timema monikensis]